MSFPGSLTSFVVGAAAGAAGGVLGARLLAPRSGSATKHALHVRKDEITTAGEMAKEKTERELEQQYRATVANRELAGERR